MLRDAVSMFFNLPTTTDNLCNVTSKFSAFPTQIYSNFVSLIAVLFVILRLMQNNNKPGETEGQTVGVFVVRHIGPSESACYLECHNVLSKVGSLSVDLHC